jgi:hypothetical protein
MISLDLSGEFDAHYQVFPQTILSLWHLYRMPRCSLLFSTTHDFSVVVRLLGIARNVLGGHAECRGDVLVSLSQKNWAHEASHCFSIPR